MTYAIAALLFIIVLMLRHACKLLCRICERLEALNKDVNDLHIPIEWVEKAIRNN